MIKSSVKKAAPKLIRQINRASILEIIKNEGPISRAEIARRRKFSKVTVSNIIRNLLEENLIKEESARTSLRGVKPIFYSLNRENHIFGAISIDSKQTTIAFVDIESKIIAKESFTTSKEKSTNFINDCIDRFDRFKNKIDAKKLIGVGVSIPGTLNFERTELIHSINLDWHNVPLMKILKKRLKEQIIIDNDTRCMALAEWTFSPNPDIRDADIFLFIKYGAACNLKINERIFSGRHNLACEFGHLIIHPAEKSGDVEFLENYISDKATVQYYQKLTNEIFNGDIEQEMEWIFRQAQMKQFAATKTIQRFTKYLAIGIANLINIFDPNGIIICAKITKIWDIIYDDLMAEIKKYTLHKDKNLFKLYSSSLGDNAAVIGAATQIIRHFLKYPTILTE